MSDEQMSEFPALHKFPKKKGEQIKILVFKSLRNIAFCETKYLFFSKFILFSKIKKVRAKFVSNSTAVIAG